jgi:MoaA/NifB/PqqE/SkfB family radical SAM enzyme
MISLMQIAKVIGVSDNNLRKSAFLNSLIPDFVPFMPSSVIVGITSKCNLQCAMCSRTINGVNSMHMELKVFSRVSECFCNKTVTLVGIGEPFLHPNIFEFIEICQLNRSNVNIVTNGTLLFEDRVQRLLQYSNLRTLTFSIDGVGDNYDRIRKGSSFKTVVNNLRQIDRLKKEKGVIFPSLSVNFVGMKTNVDDFPELIKIVGDYIDNIQMVHPLCYTREMAVNHLHKNVEHAKKIFDKSIKIADEHCVKLTLPYLMPRARGCINPWALPIVGMKGDIYPCHILVGSDQRESESEFYDDTMIIPPNDTSVGNIMTSDFDNIWNNSQIRSFRRDLSKINVFSLKQRYQGRIYTEMREKWSSSSIYCELCPNRWDCAC